MKRIINGIFGFVLLTAIAFSTYGAPNPPYSAENMRLANHWYGESAEQKAAYNEIYLMAYQTILPKARYCITHGKTWGIILDIDDTILSSESLNWSCYYNGATWIPTIWENYVKSAEMPACPGTVGFLLKIRNLGGYINLVSGRPKIYREATKHNLKNMGVAYDQLILAKDFSDTDKNPYFDAVINGKRPSILPKQDIIAWFGDNIQDFPNLNQAAVAKDPSLLDNFGKKYFVLPNPVYGSWKNNPEPHPVVSQEQQPSVQNDSSTQQVSDVL